MGAAFFDAVYRVCLRTCGFEVDTYTLVHLRPYRLQFSIPRPSNTPLECVDHKLEEIASALT